MTAGKRDLAVYGRCGDLVFAVSIDEIDRVALADDLVVSRLGGELARIQIEGEAKGMPGWDLATLLGRRGSSARTWLIVHAVVEGTARRFGLACDRSIAVRPHALDQRLPATLTKGRPGAVAAMFATAAIGSGLPPIGYALTAGSLLAEGEREAAARAAARGELTW